MANDALTVGWICVKPAQTAVVAAMIEAAPDSSVSVAVRNTHTEVYRGRTGSFSVVIVGPAQQKGTRPLSDEIQSMLALVPTAGAIIVTVDIADATLADVLIGLCVGGGTGADALSLRRAIAVLRSEIGGNGYLLERDRSAVRTSREGLPCLRYLQDFEAEKLLAVLDGGWPGSLTIKDTSPALLVVGVSSKRLGRGGTEADPLRIAVLCVNELLQLGAEPSVRTAPSLSRTEHIIPARRTIPPPPFPVYHFPRHGKTILLVTTTENKNKLAVLQESIVERAPAGVNMHTINVPADSDVGEQPYNVAGAEGAFNRIRNAVKRLQSPEFAGVFAEQAVGTVLVASIENYIQTQDLDRPADFGIAIVHNATTNQTVACSSRGVTVAPEYIDRARRFGTDGDANHGSVTVGKILAARVPGLDHADWHSVLAGVSRYELLREAIAELQIPF